MKEPKRPRGITAALSRLVEVPGESREARYSRIESVSRELDSLRSGFAPWSAEAKAAGVAVREAFRFRSWGLR